MFNSNVSLKRKEHKIYRLHTDCYNPSKELAWLVGYILGDGYITQYNIIGMKTKDDDLKRYYLKNFKKWTKNINLNFIIDFNYGKEQVFRNGVYKCKPIWSIRICFREAYLFIKKFKENPLYCLEFFPKRYWIYLLKGLWDAEGHINLYRNNIRIGFTNYNEDILRLYETFCSNFDFKYQKCKGKINISKSSDIIKFIKFVGVTIKRKYKNEVKNRVLEVTRIHKLYNKVNYLKYKGYKRRDIWIKIDKKIPLSTLDNWLYCNRNPYNLK